MIWSIVLLGCLYAAPGGCISDTVTTTESKHAFQVPTIFHAAQTLVLWSQDELNQSNRRFGELWLMAVVKMSDFAADFKGKGPG